MKATTMGRERLLGFLEGSGCFSIVIRKSGNRVGYQTIADFTIKLPLRERQLLEEVQSLLGAGRIYENSGEAILKATSLGDARKVAAFFEKEPFLSKERRREFTAWKGCVEMMGKGLHHTRTGVLEIAHLRDSVHLKALWNKKSFCSLRVEIDPCHIYEEQHSLPQGCRICWGGGQGLVKLPAGRGGE